MPDPSSIKRSSLPGLVAALALLAGCGGVRVTADNPMPRPLIEPLPLAAGLYYSKEFRTYAAHEERWHTKWSVELGAAHVAAIERLTKSMFTTVTSVADLAKPPAPPLDLILEPRFEEYSFLTPRDAGSELYAVTIKYRINVYDGAGRLIDSLVLTGYGNELAGDFSSSKPLAVATRKAMRDAGAKFVAEFPDQPVVKKLVRHEPVEPIAQGTAAAPAEGTIGEVQPAAVAPAPPAPAAATPVAAPAAAPAAGAPATPAASAPAADSPAASPAGTTSPAPEAATPKPAPAPPEAATSEPAPAPAPAPPKAAPPPSATEPVPSATAPPKPAPAPSEAATSEPAAAPAPPKPAPADAPR